jgi:hypothetical protein
MEGEPTMTPVAADKKRRKFDPQTFRSTIDGGRTTAAFPRKRMIFVQGDSADAVFLYSGRKGKTHHCVEER